MIIILGHQHFRHKEEVIVQVKLKIHIQVKYIRVFNLLIRH